MIHINIEKLDRTGIHCSNFSCKRNPEHMVNILGSVWYIKVDTTVATIEIKGQVEHYCRGCIDELYLLMKTKLDSKLWAFH